MPNDKSQTNTISSTYEELITDNNPSAIEENVITIVSRFRHFGNEATEYLNRRLKKADEEELNKLFLILPSYDQPDISKGLEYIIVERIVPLDVKVRVFEVMSQLGYSLEDEFLQHLHAAEQLYVQLGSYLKSAGEDDYARALSLKEEILSLPRSLKLSIIMEMEKEYGEKSVHFLANLVGEDEKLDEDIIDSIARLQNVTAANALHQLVDTIDTKSTIKKAKRALYLLKEKGVVPEIEDEEDEPAGVLDRNEPEEPDNAYASTFDSYGGRLLILAIPSMSRVLVCQGTIDERRGLVNFNGAEMPRKKFREFFKDLKERISKEAHSSVGQIDPRHCRWLMERGYRKVQESGNLVPSDYKPLRYKMKVSSDYEPARHYESALTIDKSKKMLFGNNADDIFEMQEIGVWIIEKEQLFPYVKRYIDLAESKLIVNDEQRQEQLEAAVEKYAREYFTDARVDAMKHRLWETALVLKGMNRKEDSAEVAALAKSIEEHADLTLHPFFKTFMIRSIIGTIHAITAHQQQQAGAAPPEEEGGDEPKIIT